MEQRIDLNLEQIKRMAEAWCGVSGNIIRIQEIRNEVCQMMNRTRFSAGVTGNDEECMRQMCCGILNQLMDLSKAPRGGLAYILGIYSTRVAAVLDRKHWPKSIGKSPRSTLQDATLWMLLGARWREEKKWFDTIDPAVQKPSGESEVLRFKAIEYCHDISDYFFPQPGDRPQPYFFAERRDWNAPYDRHEMQLVVQWTRRQVFANHGTAGLMALFATQFDSIEQLFQCPHLGPELSWAATQLSALKVMVFSDEHPTDVRREKLKKLTSRLASDKKKIAADWANPRQDKIAGEGVRYSTSQYRGSVVSTAPSMFAMMLLGYCRKEEGEPRRREHLFALRPHLAAPERKTPFCIKLGNKETDRFIETEMLRNKDFQAFLNEFRAINKYVPLSRDEW